MTITRYQFDYDDSQVRATGSAEIVASGGVAPLTTARPWVDNLATMPGVVPESVQVTTITPPPTPTVEVAITGVRGGTIKTTFPVGSTLLVNADGTLTQLS